LGTNARAKYDRSGVPTRPFGHIVSTNTTTRSVLHKSKIDLHNHQGPLHNPLHYNNPSRHFTMTILSYHSNRTQKKNDASHAFHTPGNQQKLRNSVSREQVSNGMMFSNLFKGMNESIRKAYNNDQSFISSCPTEDTLSVPSSSVDSPRIKHQTKHRRRETDSSRESTSTVDDDDIETVQLKLHGIKWRRTGANSDSYAQLNFISIDTVVAEASRKAPTRKRISSPLTKPVDEPNSLRILTRSSSCHLVLDNDLHKDYAVAVVVSSLAMSPPSSSSSSPRRPLTPMNMEITCPARSPVRQSRRASAAA
jgi:hypothetical protein